jgi:ectoine hydroxylase-related dioxygenase (phytanoyl-CoA dioxygenase family)
MSHTIAQSPTLDTPYALSEQQVQQYRRDGHILLRQVASAEEMNPYRRLIADRVFNSEKAKVPLAQRTAYCQAFVQIANLWEESPEIARFVMAKRFAKLAADLMGVDGVRLYHDQALFKEAGGGPTFWHQDQYYWPLATSNTITLWLALVDVPIEKGVLTFASQSHRDGMVCEEAISDDSDMAIREIVRQREFPISQAAMQAGDATFHSGWTLHYAPENRSSEAREIMTIIYYEDGATISEPDNPHRPVDLERWFPGQKPGEVAASRLNPLLWHRDPSKLV